MMRFTPKYTVSYRGEIHMAGKPFEIDPKDAEEMTKHGAVEKPLGSEPKLNEVGETVRRPGRPKKNAN